MTQSTAATVALSGVQALEVLKELVAAKQSLQVAADLAFTDPEVRTRSARYAAAWQAAIAFVAAPPATA